MADIQEVNAGGIQAIRQLDSEGFVLETTDGRLYKISLPPGVVGPMGPRGEQGPRGERGEMGSPGADGRDGRDGQNGSDGRSGTSVEFAQVLKDGSLALMMSTGDVINAGKVVGPAGPQGLAGRAGVPGPAGDDGSQIFLSAGPPDPATGQQGDICIDTKNWKLYQKSGLGWGSGNDMLPGANSLDQTVRRFNGGGGPGGGRFFGMGSSSGIAVGGSTGQGLEPILIYGQPITAANLSTLIATDTTGDAMLIEVWARSAQGTCFVEVAASKGIGTDSGHSTVFDIRMGAVPPKLTFTTGVAAGPNPGDPLALQVFMSSDVPLLEVRGRIVKL